MVRGPQLDGVTDHHRGLGVHDGHGGGADLHRAQFPGDDEVVSEREASRRRELDRGPAAVQPAEVGGRDVEVGQGRVSLRTSSRAICSATARAPSPAQRAIARARFVEAQDGTLFLDEIGELPLALQPKLLRVLETRRVRPLGSDTDVAVDVRVVSATHRDLASMVNEGSFREDLYFRLAVFPVEIPPLRARRDDIALLTRHFLEQVLGGLVDGRVAPPDAATLRVLERLPLEGNVRELRNLVKRAVVLCNLDDARAGRLAEAVRASAALDRRREAIPEGLEDAKRGFERGYLVALVRRHGRNRQSAAAEAGLHPKSLGRLLRRHGLTELDPDDAEVTP